MRPRTFCGTSRSASRASFCSDFADCLPVARSFPRIAAENSSRRVSRDPGTCKDVARERERLSKFYASPLRRKLRKARATASAPRRINTPAHVTHAGYNCFGGAKDVVRKKNGLAYIGARIFKGIPYQPGADVPPCADS